MVINHSVHSVFSQRDQSILMFLCVPCVSPFVPSVVKSDHEILTTAFFAENGL